MNRVWVCRAGQKAIYKDQFLSEEKIYLAWEGYAVNFANISTRDEFRSIVSKEKGTINQTSIANWSGMLWSFVNSMQIGDYVLIPGYKSHNFTLAVITGDYCYSADDLLKHSRKITIIDLEIPRQAFSQDILYSLGAYRTIFQVRDSEKVLEMIDRIKYR